MDGAVDNLPTLPDAAVWELLQRMELKTFLRSRQVCKTWHAIAKDDGLWRAQALALYPPSTVYLGSAYTTYKALVLDGNKQAAVQCTLNQCMSTRNAGQHADHCTVSKLERCQQTGTLRVHFEAHSTQRPEHSALAIALPSASGAIALDDVIMTQQASWCELHTDDQDGLYKGCLVWRNLAGIVDLLQRGPPKDHHVTSEQSSVLERGCQLLFCYASPLPVLCDYAPARLLALLPGQSLHRAMVEHGCSFVVPTRSACVC